MNLHFAHTFTQLQKILHCFCLNNYGSSRFMCCYPESPHYLDLTFNILKLALKKDLACLQHQMGLIPLTFSRREKDVQTYVTEAANPTLFTDALPGLGTAAMQAPRERNTLITKCTLPARLTPERDKRHDRTEFIFNKHNYKAVPPF